MGTVLYWLVFAVFVLAAVFFFLMPGYSFSAILCLGAAALLLCLRLLKRLARSHSLLSKVLRSVLALILCAGIAAAAITYGYIHTAALGSDTECRYLVVLGAGVNGSTPSTILQNRIDAAVSYLQAHPDVICVASGGQGANENISEAQCIRDHLTAAGINPDRILMEDKSTSTLENIRFSLDLIEAQTGTRPSSLGVLSNEFHLFRAGKIAEKCGITAYGIPARTSHLSLRINYTLREIAAVWYYFITGGI